ncbi:MAG: hypothetical protein R3217_09895 [Gammaproteobacteria bacterium]|nr:hypothetical protein [Gammaproteobacteria bacterium]
MLQLRTARTLLLACLLLFAGCAAAPPKAPLNLCSVFDEYPEWYDYAAQSEDKWGTPIHIQMAFIQRESSYVADARPAMEWFLFIPLGRPSSAEGYAQIQDPAWEDYTRANGSLFKSRSDMEDALDFIGWYNDISRKRLGISLWDPYRLYLAYHEGHGGYSRGSYRGKSKLLGVARDVEYRAREYGSQLKSCEARFQCRGWWEVGPLCSK